MPSGCGIGANHTGSSHRNILIQEELGKVNNDSLSRALSCQQVRYRKQDTSSHSSELVNAHLMSSMWRPERLGVFAIVDRAGHCPLPARADPSLGLVSIESILGTVPEAGDHVSEAWQLWLQCWGGLTLNL